MAPGGHSQTCLGLKVSGAWKTLSDPGLGPASRMGKEQTGRASTSGAFGPDKRDKAYNYERLRDSL